MKQFILIPLLLFSIFSKSQVAKDQVLPLKITFQNNQSILTWAKDESPRVNYTISQKAFNANSWSVAAQGVKDSFFVLNNLNKGEIYEYSVFKYTTDTLLSLGYIVGGNEYVPSFSKGSLLLLIDENYLIPLNDKINRLEDDIAAEGYQVKRLIISRNDDVSVIKDSIISNYNTLAPKLEALLLLGHIPVPYSGLFSGENGKIPPPDGHVEGSGNHTGAWAADVYYADIDGNWTDNSSLTTGSQTRNQNVPGDGKFDQSKLPSSADLMIGRIDFFNMPSFNESDTQLLSNYLDRNHNFRTAQWKVANRAIIDNNFKAFNIASIAYHNFSTFIDLDNIDDLSDYFTALGNQDYLWSYGCGAGSYTSCNGVGRTTDFVNKNVNNVFTSLAGSFFGDWDVKDNFLKASIANSAIATFWGGIPKWYIHQMAVGYPIGYGTKLSQNNVNLYFNGNFNFSHNSVHMALLGDPTLRMHYVNKPSNLVVSGNSGNRSLNWQAAQGADGYFVFVRSEDGTLEQLNQNPLTTTSYTDNTNRTSYPFTYLVAAAQLINNPSGTHYALSGHLLSKTFVTTQKISQSINVSVYPNPTNQYLKVAAEKEIKNASLSIYDIQGKLMYSEKNYSSKSRISVHNLPQGVYFLKIGTDKENYTAKFYILR